jgi:type IV fimbrial biogenesis protein FimT
MEKCMPTPSGLGGFNGLSASTGHPRSRGFTLVELMVVIAIVGVLIVFAAPNFSMFIQTSKLRGATSGLYEAAVLARSEAIKRGANVTISPTAGAWVNGWSVVFGGTTLRRWDPEVGVTYRDTVGGDIVYGLNGRIGGTREVVAYIGSNLKVPARCVNIDVGGRVNTKTDTDGDYSNGC